MPLSVEVQPRYHDASKTCRMRAHYNVFIDGEYCGSVSRSETWGVDGWLWGVPDPEMFQRADRSQIARLAQALAEDLMDLDA